MSVASVLAPVFVQVLLTFLLLLHTGRARLGALKAGETRLKDIALGEPNWPARPLQAAKSFDNQFQLPVLFMLLVGFALQTRQADLLFVMLNWLFVLLRIGHAGVHVTSNDVPTRFRFYVAGAVVLMVLWGIFAVHVLFGV